MIFWILFLLQTFSPSINGYVVCTGELQNGQLNITVEPYPYVPVNQYECTRLTVHIENGRTVQWNKIRRVDMPKLEIFNLYINIDKSMSTFQFEKQVRWYNLLIYKSPNTRPNDIWNLGVEFSIYVNGKIILYYNPDPEDITLNICTVDAKPILEEFNPSIQLSTLKLGGVKLSYHSIFHSKGVQHLSLDNVHVENMFEFMKKFDSLVTLNIFNFERFDICDVLVSKNLEEIETTRSHLVCEGERERSNFEAKHLKLYANSYCTIDSSFNKFLKLLISLEELYVAFPIGKPGSIDMNDILNSKNLKYFYIIYGELTFTSPNAKSKLNKLEDFNIYGCKFDLHPI